MNAADPPNRIATNQLARMVNLRLFHQLPTTRRGVRVIPLTGPDAEGISSGNIQGSIFFNPAKGQGGIVLSEQNSMIAVASAGRKFVVRITGKKSKSVGEVSDIAPLMFTDSQLHLVWPNAWEDQLLFQDGQSNCIIWNGLTSRFSQGYNTTQKERSEVPNGCTVMGYAHGRGVVVANNRAVLVGNSLHQLNSSKSTDLLRFSEQSYWATGAYFLPPSSMGGVTAAAILPQRNTQHGHGDFMVHCQDGIFSIELNVYPRSSWASSPMVKHALLDTGAVGPFAIGIYDGDQVFRSRKGIQVLRSAALQAMEGNPNQAISHEIDCWLARDYSRWLKFCSLELWDRTRRYFCTTQPIVQGRYRWHRGAVVRNVDPKETEPGTRSAWEGLLTLPPEIGGIIQFVRGLFDGEERFFAWCRNGAGRNLLVEFTDELEADVLEDGTQRAIRTQAITREIDAGEWWKLKTFNNSRLYFRNITGPLKWGVWVRSSKNPTWLPYRSGTINFAAVDPSDITRDSARVLPIALGNVPDAAYEGGKENEAMGLQFLVRWEGPCSLEGVRVTMGDKDLMQDDVTDCSYKVVFAKSPSGEYDDWEYSKFTEATWFSPAK